MPTYDYECTACGHEFELFQSITAEPETKCPSCKKRKLKRLIGTGAAVMFKGSGFYQTDYRSESYKKAAASETKSTETSSNASTADTSKAEKASTESTAKSETKPARSKKAKD